MLDLPYAGGGGENDDFEWCVGCGNLSRFDLLAFEGEHHPECPETGPHEHARCPCCADESVRRKTS